MFGLAVGKQTVAACEVNKQRGDSFPEPGHRHNTQNLAATTLNITTTACVAKLQIKQNRRGQVWLVLFHFY